MAAYAEKVEVDRQDEEVALELRRLRKEVERLDQEMLDIRNEMNQLQLQDQHNRYCRNFTLHHCKNATQGCLMNEETAPICSNGNQNDRDMKRAKEELRRGEARRRAG